MASVKKVRGRHCVVHSTTGKPLKRKNRLVCFGKRSDALREARATECRVRGGKICPIGAFKR